MKFSGQIFIFSILKTFTEIVFVISTVLPHGLFGQLQEDFSDNNLTENPVWNGSTTDFVITEGLLQLKAGSVATSSYLSTSYQVVPNVSWEFYVHLAFNPSGSNYAQVYLSSDQPDLSAPLNGYFIMIGNTADEIGLYRQTGATKIRIIDGIDAKLDVSDVKLRIRVTRDQDGSWTLWSDLGLTNEFVSEGTVVDNFVPLGSFFGLQCVFTSTRADKFFFDDIKIAANSFEDTTPPHLDSIAVISDHEIHLRFDEPIVSIEEITQQFFVNNNIGYPFEVNQSQDGGVLILSFLNSFTKDRTYTIQVQPLSDQRGNQSTILNVDFSYTPIIQAQWKDVVITEIFADPTPVVGLPEAEYIEIYNRSDINVSLKNWVITDGSSVGKIPEFLLKTKEYVLLTLTNNKKFFENYGNVLGVTSFPSLNNSGDLILIRNESGLTVDSIAYLETWYRSTAQQSGGWSLELIDTQNLCAAEQNWVVSSDQSGGTPGKVNSVAAEKPDLWGPRLESAYYSSDTLFLLFDEKLDSQPPLLNNFTISPAVQIQAVIPDKYLRKIKLIPSTPLQTKILYTVKVDNLYDCPGNLIQSCCNTLEFALPEEADSLDVVINEILFNPRSTGIDFLEIFNVSDKFIDLKDWTIGNFQSEKPQLETISTEPLVLKPGGYLAFTIDPAILSAEYPKCFPETLLKTDLPPFNNDSGIPAITNSKGKVIDSFSYYSGMHSVFIANEEGVSLERLSVSMPSTNAGNWKSASSFSGYGTPGYANSNVIHEALTDDEFSVEPEVFLPIHGQPDFAKVGYRLALPQYLCTIRIYDPAGHVIKTLIENSLLGTEGFFVWEGDREDGSKARTGTYMVWIELYNSEGVVKRIRKRVTVASKF
jgi:Lamin Tail Domain